MKRNFLKVLAAFLFMFAVSNAVADTVTLPQPPGNGLGLGCTLCDIKRAPDPQPPPRPVRPTVEMQRWFFVSFWGENPGVHGPYTTKRACDEARTLFYDTEECFLDTGDYKIQ
ncbi:MAG: hypothetical protein WC791_03075 [Candidatus Paceibacterota bacterium]|jgi:hypothetical protein